jgi:hypothetical protein
LSLCDKKREKFLFWTGNVFPNQSCDFCPEWPKWEFVSILASFCVWTKSLMCKDAANRDSTIQSMQVRRIQVPCQPSGRSSHPVRSPICPLFRPDDVSTVRTSKIDQHHLSGRSVHPVRTPYCIEKFLCQLASVRTFQQHVRTPPSTRSIFDFFPNYKKGKINQPSGRASP